MCPRQQVRHETRRANGCTYGVWRGEVTYTDIDPGLQKSERAFSSLRTSTRGRIPRSNNCRTTRYPTSPVEPVIKYIIVLFSMVSASFRDLTYGNKARGKERSVYSHSACQVTHGKLEGCRRGASRAWSVLK